MHIFQYLHISNLNASKMVASPPKPAGTGKGSRAGIGLSKDICLHLASK